MMQAAPTLAEPDAAGSRPRDWFDAAIITVFFWSLIVVLYLPVLLARHPGEGLGSAAIEGATVLVAMAFCMIAFAIDRAAAPGGLTARIVALGACILVLAACQTTIDAAFTYWIAIAYKPHWSRALPTIADSYAPFFTYVCLYAFNVALFQLVFWRRHAAHLRIQAAEARLAAKQAELVALRFQLNPHFLFNSLNAVSSLIMTERYRDAEVMTDRLAEFLRHALVSEPTALVSLETEFSTLENYLEVERVRFGERLMVKIELDPSAANARVPSFILQPLVENAIKYGVARSSGPCRISIAAAREKAGTMIRIANQVPETGAPAAPGTGVGLVNVRERLRAAFEDAADLEVHASEGWFEVLMRVPNTTELAQA